ncbi:LANO_0G12134g1_1 [Lachancea nothofagi CBS 11611]|uniref:LANO_0G12134g1_1 n=1 Tax=Lachancea nothofagi CBS 11611 TaxID=1266666 RepID=A0A1G4KJU4_9SACH|nr:LANO_0G12134g1_1 [Lachancea nothofagi CBS 11611]
MSRTINTRKFVRNVRDELVKTLNKISNGEASQILVMQAKLVPFLNGLCTFTQLTEATAVTKIVIDDTNCRETLEELVADSQCQLVFVVDVRSDLRLPSEFRKTIELFEPQGPQMVYLAWETEPSNVQGKLPHFLSLQLDQKVNVYPWYVLPTCVLDDNLLNTGVLYNSDGDNLYLPPIKSMQKATRSILVQNLSNAIQAVLKETGLVITHASSFGNTCHGLVDHLRRDLESRKDETDEFIDETLYGNRHSGLQCNLVVFERDMDLLTPLCSQLTYGGILDDLYEIDDKHLKHPPELSDIDVISLDYAKDEVWNELKFKNFGALGPRLNELARELQAEYDARHQAESVGEIKQFVENLGGLQERQKLLKLHTALSSKVVSEVTEKDEGDEESFFNRVMELEQDLIAGNLGQRSSCEKILELLHEGHPPYSALVRLCCIFSLTRNGIREREYNLLRTEIIDAWGVDAMFELQRLARAGMFLSKQNFTEHSLWSDFDSFAGYLDLVPQIVGETDPGKPVENSFAYCGTVPIITRAIQFLFDRSIVTKTFSSQQPFIISRTPSWGGLEELFGQQYGSGILREQVWDQSASPRTKFIGKPAKNVADPVLVAVLGGITVGEMATLQFLATQLRQKDIHKRFIVITDGIVGGSRLKCSSVKVV